MAERSTAQLVLGALVAGTGLALAATAVLGDPLLPAIASLPADLVTWGVAGFLALAGVLLALTSGRPEEGPAPSVPADVAFISRAPAAPLAALEREPTKPARPAPSRATTTLSGELDEEIRELTRKINRAGVMLATGKLSGEGYAKYVEELKRQRGALEADRVRGEMAR